MSKCLFDGGGVRTVPSPSPLYRSLLPILMPFIAPPVARAWAPGRSREHPTSARKLLFPLHPPYSVGVEENTGEG